MAYGAATGAFTGAVTGGLTSSLNSGNFWDGAGKGALWGGALGAVTGGIAGGIDAYNKGNNVWWGTEPKNWAHNRGQWSLGWWDKPDVARSPIKSVAGEFSQGCVPAGMESIADSYGLTNQDQYFWKSEYQNYTGQPFNGVDPNKLENFVESVNGYNVDKITKDNVFSTFQAGKRVGIGVSNYGQNGGGHFMVVNTMKVWPNGNFKLILMNPDGGGRYFINQRNFFNYGARFWSIYR